MGEVLEAILLGLVQGLTEFLPVSSSGHLALFQALLGWEDPEANLSFNIAVHMGSLVAVLVFVRKEIIAMLSTAPRLILVLSVATLPIVVAVMGTPAKEVVQDLSSNIIWVGALLLCTSAILVVAMRIPDGDTEAPRLGLSRAAMVGVAQILAILPGISRSGTTLTAGMGVGLQREHAVRFAFLMAVPAIGGAFVFMVKDGGLAGDLSLGPMLAGAVVSFFASLLAMKLMVGVVQRRRLGWFAIYCAAVGLLAIGVGLAT